MKYLVLLLAFLATASFAQQPAESVEEIRLRFEANSRRAPPIAKDQYYQSIVIHILDDEQLSQELEAVVMQDFQNTVGKEVVDEITLIFLPAIPNTGMVGWTYRRGCPSKEVMEALQMVCRIVKLK